MMSLRFAAGFFAELAPVLLVAYITTMFSADIRYGLQHAKLLRKPTTSPALQHPRLRDCR